MISFIIPAHNEEALLGRTLDAIRAAAPLDRPHEIVVANDASTDRTAEVARAGGARVVDVSHRQIAATRNAGARAALGDVFIFVDADTQVTRIAVRRALQELAKGAAGGGSLVFFDGRVPLYGRVLLAVLRMTARPIGLAGGCFLFCTRANFAASGGFDESLFASEEIEFAQELRKRGRFVVLRESVITSGRKVRSHTLFGMLRLLLRFMWEGPSSLRRREGLEFWYGPR